MIAFEPYSFIATFPLVTIPLFLLMGYLAFHAGFTSDIYHAARVWLSKLHGSLALASVTGCAAFAAVSGSSMATCAAMGKLAVPEMLRYKYDKGLATGVVAASGTLGSLIPPSIIMIIYALFTEESVGKLLLAGLIPGILSALIYMGMIWIRVKRNPELAPAAESVTWGERLAALRGTWSIIALIALVIGGIYTGIVTPTESAAIGASGALLLGIISRRLNFSNTLDAVVETVKQTSSIFVLVVGAKIFVSFIAFTGLAASVAGWVAALEAEPIIVIIAMSVVFIILGTFMDPIGIMLLALPVVTPIVQDMGYSMIWFGVIMVKYLEIGLITPPVGLNIFILKSTVGNSVSLEQMFKGIWWFLAMDILTLAILIAFPAISLWLPGQL